MSIEANPQYGPHVEPDADDIRRPRHHRRRYLAGWGMLAALLLLIGTLWFVSDLDIRITWPNPAPITYPTPLGLDQLNPKSTIGGRWDFDPTTGTVLSPGLAQPLHARLTPNLLRLEGFVPLEIVLVAGIIALAIGLGRWRHWRREYPLPLRVAGALLAIGIGFFILFRGTSANAAIDVLPGKATLGLGNIPAQVYSPQATPIPVYVTVNPTAAVTVSAAGNCQMSGSSAVLVIGAGNCAVTAHEDAQTNYQAPPDASISFPIAKANLAVVWPQPAPIVQGTPLGPNQLNAASTPAAPATYSPAAGTVLPAGNQVLNANFVPQGKDAANYEGASATRTLLVMTPTPTTTTPPTLAPQTITFGPIADKTLGDPSFTVSASASSKLPAAITSNSSTICTVPANSQDSAAVTMLATGACSLTASQPGDGKTWAPASPVTQTFQVKPTATTPPPVSIPITWTDPAPVCTGATLIGLQLNAKVPPGIAKEPGTYKPQAGTPMIIAGTQQLSVTFYPLDPTKYITNTAYVNLVVRNCMGEGEFLKNGSFEQGFTTTADATTVGTFWQPYNNGGANVEYGYYDDKKWGDSIYTVVADGEHAQEIEIGTKLSPQKWPVSTPNRAAGISQKVTGLLIGRTYTLKMYGVIRVSEGDPDTDNRSYVAQWGIDTTGKGADGVTQWNDIPWTHVSFEHSPAKPELYQTQMKATGDTMTLFIRLLKKPGKGQVELNLDLDGLSLWGPMLVAAK